MDLAVERPCMTTDTLEDAEDAIERATELDDEEALSLLQATRRDLQDCRAEGSVEEERADALEDQLTQRIREVSEREKYDVGLGSAMNPEDEDAP